MSAQLVPLNAGPLPTIALRSPVLLIGRHPECDVRIDLAKVSRRHCCLALAYDRVVIRDLGSRNGLRVNGRLVEECRLYHGDEVAIGPLLYRVDFPDDRAAPSPAPGAKKAVPPAPPSLPELPVDPQDPDGDLSPLVD